MYTWQTFILGLCEHLAWPILVGGCIFIFKNDIRKILSRLTKLPGGAELNPETVEEQKENKTTFDELLIKKAEEKNNKEEEIIMKSTEGK